VELALVAVRKGRSGPAKRDVEKGEANSGNRGEGGEGRDGLPQGGGEDRAVPIGTISGKTMRNAERPLHFYLLE